MLFDKNIDPCCAYCRHGTDLGNDEVACRKQGIMTSHGSCKHFSYEPTKRIPKAGMQFDASGFTEDDFTLE